MEHGNHLEQRAGARLVMAACLILAPLSLAAGAACAQAATDDPAAGSQATGTPALRGDAGRGDATSLGNGAAHGGVIVPPPTGDSEISKPVPQAKTFPMPVIPPPGTAGNQPGVQPK